MVREQLEEYRRTGRLVPSSMYLRKSRAEEHLSLTETLARHRAALMAYAERNGFLVQEEDIYEEVVSGESLFARPQMLRLLEAVSSGKYEAVLCMDMQRLGRGGMYDQGMILDTFKYAETLIVTPERIYDLTKEMDEEAAEMQTFLSRSEYRMITKRLRRGVAQSVESGAYLSNAPFGYRKVTVDKTPTLEIVPEEAEIVRLIYQMYRDGSGCTKIEQAINAMGVHGRRGSRFNRNTIRLILDNPVYIGKVRWNKTSTVKSGIGEQRKKSVVYNKADHWKIVDGKHPAIIDIDLWNAVQERRKSRYFYVDNKHVASPLAGLVRCSKCGRLMNLQGKNKGVPYLLCATPGCCAGAKFELVEQSILLQLEEIAKGLEISIQHNGPPDTSKLEAALQKALEQVTKLDARRDRLYSLLEDGIYNRDVFAQRMEVLTQDEAHLRDHIASLEAEIQAERSKDKRVQLARLKTIIQRYHTSSLAGKKELLQSAISVIYYTKEKKTKPADFKLNIVLLPAVTDE